VLLYSFIMCFILFYYVFYTLLLCVLYSFIMCFILFSYVFYTLLLSAFYSFIMCFILFYYVIRKWWSVAYELRHCDLGLWRQGHIIAFSYYFVRDLWPQCLFSECPISKISLSCSLQFFLKIIWFPNLSTVSVHEQKLIPEIRRACTVN
jgi:hypothetical protein